MSLIPALQVVSIPQWKRWYIIVVVAVILVSAGASQTASMYMDALAIAGLLAEAVAQQRNTVTTAPSPIR
ncbi:hypothetical protein [Streptomyces sp. NPDC088707]|uniref:hypothetical protein n=1 Tax=Streptomyces sp. NPDC088707 TaxID=3365871 RepID=UPI00382559DA